MTRTSSRFPSADLFDGVRHSHSTSVRFHRSCSWLDALVFPFREIADDTLMNIQPDFFFDVLGNKISTPRAKGKADIEELT